ncbi:ovarian cancer G-protein coupled receptor 1-like, partial [Scomber scombrus]
LLFYVSLVVVIISLPLTILAIYALYSQVRHNHVAPIYVINLLISDLIQLCCMATMLGIPKGDLDLVYIIFLIHLVGVMASVGFMVCISLERYLLIAWPLWYRFRRTIKVSVVVCLVVWVLALVISCSILFIHNVLFIGVILLLPLPVLIFSVVGIIKGLSAAISVSSEEKRRIVGATILVLLNYTLLFLPYIIVTITQDFTIPTLAFIFFNPLGDLVLYVFMRKGAIDKILASLCCCRMETQQQQIIAVNDDSMKTVSSVYGEKVRGVKEEIQTVN